MASSRGHWSKGGKFVMGQYRPRRRLSAATRYGSGRVGYGTGRGGTSGMGRVGAAAGAASLAQRRR